MRGWKPGLLTMLVINQVWEVLKKESRYIERDPCFRVIIYCGIYNIEYMQYTIYNVEEDLLKPDRGGRQRS